MFSYIEQILWITLTRCYFLWIVDHSGLPKHFVHILILNQINGMINVLVSFLCHFYPTCRFSLQNLSINDINKIELLNKVNHLYFLYIPNETNVKCLRHSKSAIKLIAILIFHLFLSSSFHSCVLWMCNDSYSYYHQFKWDHGYRTNIANERSYVTHEFKLNDILNLVFKYLL